MNFEALHVSMAPLLPTCPPVLARFCTGWGTSDAAALLDFKNGLLLQLSI